MNLYVKKNGKYYDELVVPSTKNPSVCKYNQERRDIYEKTRVL